MYLKDRKLEGDVKSFRVNDQNKKIKIEFFDSKKAI